MLLNVTESVSQMKEYVEAVDLRAELVALIQLCQSMHYILVPTDKALEQAGDNMPDVEMNPCKLMCTCKGFRMIGLCSHTMALTCRLDNGYNQAFLESLLQKLVTKRGLNIAQRRLLVASTSSPTVTLHQMTQTTMMTMRTIWTICDGAEYE